MIRLHVIDRASRGAYADALAQHHALRCADAGESGCRTLRAVDAAGRDRFDGEATRYLLAIDDDGQVAGGTRLLPSDEPTLLSEIFPHLAEIRGFERGPATWECTRFFASARFREDRPLSRAAGVVAAGLIEHCLEQGIPRLNLVIETCWIPQMADIGWNPRPLGLPAVTAGVSLCAVTIAMTEEALETTRAAYGVDTPVLAGARPSIPPARARPGCGLTA
ncbi:acyl-homoserine-lactone synthase [Methylobacterium sp. Gmos1]